ncbi:GNAT family N-acetyltransferase [Desulfobotulus mexicanus]|uniref:GNAT family N-acetyltransferase n=1 Tax=Desulfobotulus mexicanus TaxID=2586642 RepID=A0A5Q4VFY4_9BACT|nr:GNAT family N-acetyltransferase [Desulfobotulus mexicanus]TYT74921.1 GNAT family N-acetyltransferase [Desulfobotulus mexicanus]
MPEILVLKNPGLTECRDIMALYQAENWWQGPEDLTLVARIIAGSHLFLTARTENRIIAMGRVISDGVCDAYIQDVTVHKDWRGQGIGARIIQELCQLLATEGIEWIGLIAERGSHPFYEKLDFGIMPGSLPMLHGKTLKMMGFAPDVSGKK